MKKQPIEAYVKIGLPEADSIACVAAKPMDSAQFC